MLWDGSSADDEFQRRMEFACRVGRGLAHWKGMVVGTEHGKPVFSSKHLSCVLPPILNDEVRTIMPVEVKMLTELTDEVQDVLEKYQGKVREFRGAVKNDITAAKASAVALEENAHRMAVAYKNTQNLLISPEFERAIANAERMASALKAISELQSHSITFAVLDKKTAT